MFDIGWSEILVIAIVAIVVVGPKELPGMLRAFGRTLGMVRRTANDFRRQFDEALREAERQADLEDTREMLASLRKDPLADVKRDLDTSVRSAGTPPPGVTPTTPGTPAAPTPSTPAAATPTPSALATASASVSAESSPAAAEPSPAAEAAPAIPEPAGETSAAPVTQKTESGSAA